MFRSLGVSAIAVTVGLAAGPANAQEYNFAVLMKTLANPFWGAMGEGVGDGLEAFGVGGTVQAVASESDVEPQLNTCMTLLQSEPDALITAAINSVNLLPCLREANAMGIPIVDLDGNLDPEILAAEGIEIAFVISSDNYRAGGQGADYVAERLGADSDAAVLVIEGLAGNVTGAARRDGFIDRLAEVAPGMTIEATLPGDWDRLRAANITNDILVRNPDLAAIYAANDTMALGAVESVFAAGRGGGIVVVGTDGNSDAVRSIRDGRLDASVAQLPYLVGYSAVEMMIDMLGGTEVPERVIVDTLVLDQQILEDGSEPLLEYVR